MKGAKIVIECLKEQGIKHIFGYPGGAVLDIFNELYNDSESLKAIISSHEQGACFAAEGYYRASGKCSVVLGTSGPGATNLVTGIANAYMDSIPLVIITGNVPRALFGKRSFQGIDIIKVTHSITKKNYQVKNIEELADTLRDAFSFAASGRPGPILIDIPKDIQQEDTEYLFKQIKKEKEKVGFDINGDFQEIITLINESKKPLIYYGGGILAGDACKELIAFAEKIKSPIASSLMGLSAVPTSHPNYLGMIGMHGHLSVTEALKNCDVLITLGARFSDRVTGDKEKFSQLAKIIHVDIDENEIGKNIEPLFSIVGDIKEVLNEFLLKTKEKKSTNWLLECTKIPSTVEEIESNLRIKPSDVFSCINKYKADNAVVITDVGQHQIWAAQHSTFETPRTFITSGGLGAMGFGLGAAIGSYLGTENQTILITGDGSFHMNFNELATAKKLELPIVIILFDNNTLGMVRQWQTLFYKENYSNTTLNLPTNYEFLAKTFDAEYFEISNRNDVENTLKKALSCNKLTLVNIKINIDEMVLPIIPAGKHFDDMILTNSKLC